MALRSGAPLGRDTGAVMSLICVSPSASDFPFVTGLTGCGETVCPFSVSWAGGDDGVLEADVGADESVGSGSPSVAVLMGVSPSASAFSPITSFGYGLWARKWGFARVSTTRTEDPSDG